MTQSEDQARAERFFQPPSDFTVRRITDAVGSGIPIQAESQDTEVADHES